MNRIRIQALFASLLLMLGASGCVSREMVITSEPSGAKVTVNETWTGTTPFTLRYKHYGTYRFRLEKEGHHPMDIKEPVAAPLYQQPGADFVSQVLVPARIEDNRQFHYILEPIGDADDKAEIIKRSQELKERAGSIASDRETRDESRQTLSLPLKTKKEADHGAPAQTEKEKSPASSPKK